MLASSTMMFPIVCAAVLLAYDILLLHGICVCNTCAHRQVNL